jgi:AraC-like DNA-binding protein
MLPGLKIATCAISPSCWRLTRAMIDPGTEEFGVMFGSVGSAFLSQRGRSFELGVGDAGACFHSEPADLTLPRGSGRHVGLVVPLKPLAALAPDIEARRPCRIAGDSDALRLLTSYLDVLADATTLASPELRRAVVTHVHDLIALAMGATRDGAELASGRGLRAARLRAVKGDVLANLASHDLSVTTVAKRQRITPRYVHMLFEREGTTFSRFVLRARLAAANRMLADMRHDQRSIAAIAYEAGFGDLSYFNRMFRSCYGATPREIRTSVPQSRPRADVDDGW